MRKVNILQTELDLASLREGYRWRGAAVGEGAGGEQIGAFLYELEDGQRSAPYRFHHGSEHWLVVVAGTPRLRTPAGERLLQRGDVVCFPPGPGGAHQVGGPGTVMLLSQRRELDAVEYPDSGKIELQPPGAIFRSADAVDFWDGE
ncbi:MAG TPA: cupin domain-containing protein [Gaiellales bacterium]